MLTIEGANCFYGDFQVLHNVSLSVKEGEIAALLGPNAAGKSTTLAAVSGLLKCRSGLITFRGNDLNKLKPEEIVELGVAMVPEGRKLFKTLTVKENLEMGAYSRRARPELKTTIEQVFSLFPILKQRIGQRAGLLSGGEQQMCAIGRSLMAKPKLLMIDEMSLGLSPLLTRHMFEMVQHIASSGVTVLLVEQQVHHTMRIANTTYIMEKGHIVTSGPSREIAGNEHVKKAYLGK
ncbi:MAG: ABC transporter ATP-binding protein [Syntrophobacteraceae bacterium]